MRKMQNNNQQGSVLIVVLVMLLLLTLAGTWATRGSLTSLNVATNAQAQALLLQNSDSVFYGLERKAKDDLKFAQMRIGDGMLAFALRPENTAKELVFCVRGNVSDNFEGSRLASVVYWQGATIKNSDMGKNGFCQIGRDSDFISGRKAVITQVTVRASKNTNDWEHLLEGDDKESSKSSGIQKVIITATSILPNLSKSSKAQIDTCLTNYTSFYDEVIKNKTVTDCLAEKNVPYSTQDMEYTLRAASAS